VEAAPQSPPRASIDGVTQHAANANPGAAGTATPNGAAKAKGAQKDRAEGEAPLTRHTSALLASPWT